MKSICVVLCLVSAFVAADPLAEKWQKRIDVAGATRAAAVRKADDIRFSAILKANKDMETAVKKVLADAVKVKDFEAAAMLKEKAAAAEKDGSGRSKWTKIVKLAGHEYAYVDEKATWSVAQRRCAEMGGHLATLETKNEAAFVKDMITQTGQPAWIGATDEEVEGQWVWVNGNVVDDFVTKDARIDNSGEEGQHYLYLQGDRWDDGGNSRKPFICEWDN